MGGRGASSASANGTYVKLDRNGEPKKNPDGSLQVGRYGSEFKSIARFDTSRGEVKVLEQAVSGNNKKPLETMTPGRVYATVHADGHINNIYFYDESGRSVEEWNIGDHPHYGSRYHKHIGYYHSENGGRPLNEAEMDYVREVEAKWRSFLRK